MSDKVESEVEHTLFIVERDDLDDAVPYQVMKAEHPPDSEQAKALEGVMCQLVEAAEDETGEPHRLVTEVDTPEVTQAHYEMHEERIEGETLVTDGGVDQSEAEIERADPDEVDKEPVMSISECPNCGRHTLATVRVEDAEYIASCSSCEHDVRAPVVVGDDGGHKVDFDSEVA